MLLRMFSKQKRPIDTGPLGTSPTILSTPDRRPEVVDVQSDFIFCSGITNMAHSTGLLTKNPRLPQSTSQRGLSELTIVKKF
jgi:hypothetical protein